MISMRGVLCDNTECLYKTKKDICLIKQALLPFVIISALLLSACNTISVSQQTPARAISEQRGNIVSDNKLSHTTKNALLSAGLNETACLQHFDLCLTQLTESMLSPHYRPELAIFAELHYAKAKKLLASQRCQVALARPPIDPYYANAPLTKEEADIKQQQAQECITSYQARLFDAIKTSYAYLFYDNLEHDFEGAKDSPDTFKLPHRIPNDIDIQTQDVYNAASNDVITQLYESSEHSYRQMKDTKVTYLPITQAASDLTTTAAIANKAPKNGKSTDQVKVMAVHMPDYDLDIYLPNENNYLQNAHKQDSALADLTSTYEMRLSGLNTISKRSGLGISLVASLDDRYTTTIRDVLTASLSDRLSPSDANEIDDSAASSRIYPTGHLLMTGLVIPEGNSMLDVLSSDKLDVHLYNPYRSESVTILGQAYPLAANFSAGYGMWLAENQLDGVGYLNLLSPQQKNVLPKLFMLEPFDPNKRVIIMLHGLASSPATWVNLTNDILNDDALRDNYQVWQVFYSTNLPILENRYQIQKLIQTAYAQTDPSGDARASKNSVIISHSMGAIIARMMLSDDNLVDNLDTLDEQYDLTSTHQRQVDDLLKQAFGRQVLAERFNLQALPQVDTAVFLSAPFRGTDYADRWFTRALRRIIYLPVGLVKTVTDNLATIVTQGNLAQNPLGELYLQNGASQLSNQSSFIKLTRDIDINKNVTYHSIIANNDSDITTGIAQLQPSGGRIDLSQLIPKDDQSSDSADIGSADDQVPKKTAVAAVTINKDISQAQALTSRLSDGIVPYASAHLDGAASETIITGGHSIQENPQTVLTLRHILHQQLKPE